MSEKGLELELSEHFAKHEFTWKLTDGNVSPSEVDMLDALDKAAEVLYDEPVGAQLEVGRLIIAKTHTGFDVYAFFGSYI